METPSLGDEPDAICVSRRTPYSGQNPLMQSFLAPAGANRPQSGPEDGILTGLEVSRLHLTGTRPVVLSTCPSGQGTPVEGLGVMGLRGGIAGRVRLRCRATTTAAHSNCASAGGQPRQRNPRWLRSRAAPWCFRLRAFPQRCRLPLRSVRQRTRTHRDSLSTGSRLARSAIVVRGMGQSRMR
jgi:hypothetical protein